MKNQPHIWLRAETKPFEERRALSPRNAKMLVEQGFRVTVERSRQSIFGAAEYQAAGCECVAEGSWVEGAPPEAYIIGLKDLPASPAALRHRHIYFAHAYKGQAGWQEILSRFAAGGGALLDLEYLTDSEQRRVAAFGYWAGFAGAAVAVRAWCAQQNRKPLKDLTSFPDEHAMIEALRAELGKGKPRMIVIGARGRCGQGATAVAEKLGLGVTRWDLAETEAGGPFPEILAHDIFVNCVFLSQPIPPFLTRDTITTEERDLSVICDVSCDPSSNLNPLPFYSECTNFSNPCLRVGDGDTPLDLVAIDHLPSLLPAESSDDFSTQLLPALRDIENDSDGMWRRAHDIFVEKSSSLR